MYNKDRSYRVPPRLQRVAGVDARLDGKEHAMVCAIGLVHVGGTRCVTSSTDNIMNIQARVTLTVEFIRACILICVFLCANTMTGLVNTNASFFD